MDADQVFQKLEELKQDEAMKEYYDRTDQSQPPVYESKVRVDPPLVQKIRDEFPFFAIASVIYAILYTFCLYKNSSGITAPIYAVATIAYFYLGIRKMGIQIKRESLFYAVGILLLGINLCMTDDGFIIVCDYIGIFLLLFSGLLHQFYEDKDWGLSENLSAIFSTALGAIESVAAPFVDLKIWKSRQKKEEKNPLWKSILSGVLIGLPLLIVVLALLSSADVVFGRFFQRFFRAFSMLEGIGDGVGIAVMTILVFLLSYGILVKLAGCQKMDFHGKGKNGEPVIAIMINAMLAVVYLLFSVIQILYLFLGRFSLPDGYTYAEYARQGFFQLLVVCMINIVLVLICLYRFKESKVLKGMLTVISGCTYIMIASSALRMRMYVEAYDLTYLRVLVFWGLGLLFFLMSGIMVYIFYQKFPLFQYCTVVVTVLYLGLAYAHPDYLIASCNLNEQHISGHVDYHYLERLSADAFPAFRDAMEREEDSEYYEELSEGFDSYMIRQERYRGSEKNVSLRRYNFSRARQENGL